MWTVRQKERLQAKGADAGLAYLELNYRNNFPAKCFDLSNLSSFSYSFTFNRAESIQHAHYSHSGRNCAYLNCHKARVGVEAIFNEEYGTSTHHEEVRQEEREGKSVVLLPVNDRVITLKPRSEEEVAHKDQAELERENIRQQSEEPSRTLVLID